MSVVEPELSRVPYQGSPQCRTACRKQLTWAEAATNYSWLGRGVGWGWWALNAKHKAVVVPPVQWWKEDPVQNLRAGQTEHWLQRGAAAPPAGYRAERARLCLGKGCCSSRCHPQTRALLGSPTVTAWLRGMRWRGGWCSTETVQAVAYTRQNESLNSSCPVLSLKYRTARGLTSHHLVQGCSKLCRTHNSTR